MHGKRPQEEGLAVDSIHRGRARVHLVDVALGTADHGVALCTAEGVNLRGIVSLAVVVRVRPRRRIEQLETMASVLHVGRRRAGVRLDRKQVRLHNVPRHDVDVAALTRAPSSDVNIIDNRSLGFKGPNKRIRLQQMTRLSEYGTDIGGALMAALP